MRMGLIKLKSWFALNKLSLNISKTNYRGHIVFAKVDKDELVFALLYGRVFRVAVTIISY